VSTLCLRRKPQCASIPGRTRPDRGIPTLHHLFPPFGQKVFYAAATPFNGSASS
jgi:hypothetical protein